MGLFRAGCLYSAADGVNCLTALSIPPNVRSIRQKRKGFAVFENYPKKRPPLSPNLASIYASHYRANRDGDTAATSVAQRLEKWLHRQVAADIAGPKTTDKSTLELGAGTLNQLSFEPDSDSYDIVEPFTSLFADSPKRSGIRNVYKDISEVPDNQRYDRITSCAVLEHVCDLPQVVAKSGLLLNPMGTFRAAIPAEGTILWTLAWKLTTGLEFRLKYGLDYGELMRHEHVNTADEIEQMLRWFFKQVRRRVFGISAGLSLYRFYECRAPNEARCREFVTVATHK